MLLHYIFVTMNRKNFIRNSLLGGAGLALTGSQIRGGNTTNSISTYDSMKKQVGFNHLPNKELNTMNSVLHKADSRGHADHGWLKSHHSFSFANYYNPERMHFGVLRVLNDDEVAPGKGFSKHPHDNMEIISIPLEGDLEHKDSMGNTTVIKNGDIQVMSAGTGVAHSEYNKNSDRKVKFLQIWLFPDEKDVNPRYDQITLNNEKLKNNLYQVLSPNREDEGVWIHQQAWFYMGNLDKGFKTSYTLNRNENGLYVFLLDGMIRAGEQLLEKRDGYGIWDTTEVQLEALEPSRVLLMDVPMHLS